jgi:uncharacterized protein YbjQ (UPF0145 family)
VSSFVFGLVTTVALGVVGWIFGGLAERRHLRALGRAESELSWLEVSDISRFGDGAFADAGSTLVHGEVVIANDYLKGFWAALRSFLGGELRAYGPLMSRARREALVRLQRHAAGLGHDAVCNVRLDFSRVGAMSFAVLASGTAYTRIDRVKGRP